MKHEAVLCLDVGGTNIDGAAVSHEAQVIGNVLKIRSPSDKDLDSSINDFSNLLISLKEQASQQGYSPVAYGIGMPGPFDYEKGVSYMKHKFTSLYGQNLKQELEGKIGLPVHFLNDAAAFGLGAYWKQRPDVNRLIGITLGTGLGSSFIKDGKNVTSDEGVTSKGEVWDFPYKDGILEDTVSGKGVIALYESIAGTPKDPKEIEELARSGDEAAVKTYRMLGEVLGEGLALAGAEFTPDAVVIGGKIGRAFDLFGEIAACAFAESAGYPTSFEQAESEELALFGSALNAFRQIGSRSA